MEASSVDPTAADPRHVIPHDERPQVGDVFKVRVLPGELSLREIAWRAKNCLDVALDVYNPVDPSVCYVIGDNDRWMFEIENSLVTDERLEFTGTWTNQAFNGLKTVRMSFTFAKPDEGELKFIG